MEKAGTRGEKADLMALKDTIKHYEKMGGLSKTVLSLHMDTSRDKELLQLMPRTRLSIKHLEKIILTFVLLNLAISLLAISAYREMRVRVLKLEKQQQSKTR